MPVKPRVFISYSHDSAAHKARVLDLAQSLRRDGIAAELDQYHETEILHWPRWCCEQSAPDKADYVLCVCTAEYLARINGDVPADVGRGVFWEGTLFISDLYDAKGTSRLLPVLLDDEPEASIPRFLRGWTFCRLAEFATPASGYAYLLRVLTGQQRIVREMLGDLAIFTGASIKLPAHGTPHFLGRDAELAALDAAWADVRGTDLFTCVAIGGTGKTALVRRWLDRLKQADWCKAQRVFAWSFYSQGTSEDRQASEDAFLTRALEFFGVQIDANASADDKGRRLAAEIARTRTLLVLDGLEPLQYPPGPMAGHLRAPGVKALLQTLADQGQPGLCVVTTREALADLAEYERSDSNPDGRLRRLDLGQLAPPDGARLLHRLGVRHAGAGELAPDDAELQQASREVLGHALTLHVLGLYLAKAHGGDVRRRDTLDLGEVAANYRKPAEAAYGHAFKVIRAYECWLEGNGDDGARQLAVLRLLGLFDRPATPDCLRALRQAPAIEGLTDSLTGLSEPEWNALLSDLQTAGLVQLAPWQPVAVEGYGEELTRKRIASVAKNIDFPLGPSQSFTPPGRPVAADARSLDAHPLLREFFAHRLAEPAARAGHSRLYEHLCASAPYWPEGESGLQPLYQAVAHGCRARRYQEACDEVYRDRINRRDEFYATYELGLYGTDLAALVDFFDEPWRRPVAAPALRDAARSWLLDLAAFRLRTLGRLVEAVEPMQAGLEMAVAQKNWQSAAASANNLSQLHLALGALPAAIAAAAQAVRHADASRDAFLRMVTRTTLADARLQAGDAAAALAGLAEAEALQRQDEPWYPRLYSLQGRRYCDALLLAAERAAWAAGAGAALTEAECALRLTKVQAVTERAAWALAIAERSHWPLEIALDHLTLARVALYRTWLLASMEPQAAATARSEATRAAGQAVDGLRKAGDQDDLPRGLLTRACVLHGNGKDAAARADLDEAERIAERGGMKLMLADVHLHRARLFHDRTALDAARELIDEIGYERRRGELDDAQCWFDGRAVVLPEFESVLAQARGENLPEPPPAKKPGHESRPDIATLLQLLRQLDEPALEALLKQIDDPGARAFFRQMWKQVRQQ